MSAQAVRLTGIDIDNALQNAHLEIAFQPIVAFSGRQLRRYEAFVRWDHPGLGPLPPGAFLSFFESQGRIGELTRYVLGNTLASAVTAELPDGVGVSINLSVADLNDPTLPKTVTKMLKTYEWPAKRLTLECPLFSPDTPIDVQAKAYQRLAETGCPLALEVRGRASDAMKGLDPFPFTEIKTGGPAVLRQVRSSRGGPGLNTLSELLSFAKERNVEITAVGVEDHEAATALDSLGFDLGQGNALGRAASLPAGTKSEAVAAPVEKAPSASAEPPLDLSSEEDQRRADSHTRRARIAAAKRVAMRRLKAVSTPAEDSGDATPDAIATARSLQSRLEQHFPKDAALPEEADEEKVSAEITSLAEAAAAPVENESSVEALLRELPADIRETKITDTLKAECTDPADTLDEVVNDLPVLPTDTADDPADKPELITDSTLFAEREYVPDEPPLWLHLLQKKYRITHFWPRSWRRWHRERMAAREERLEELETVREDDPIRSERREENPVPVMSEREVHPLVFGPMADLR